MTPFLRLEQIFARKHAQPNDDAEKRFKDVLELAS